MANAIQWKEYYSPEDEAEEEENQADLMYLFFDQTDMDAEEVYSLVFMDGRKISWQ